LSGSAIFLQDLAVILVMAAVTTVLCQRLRLPVIVGYIVAGLVVGPATPFHLVEDLEAIRTLAELGVILLMYSIGLEFSLRRLAKLLPVVGPAGAVEVGLMLALGVLAGKALGWNVRDSLFLGGIVAISSTMIVAKAFADRRPSRRLEDLVLGVLVVEDLVAILLIVLLTAVASGQGVSADALGKVLGRLFGFLALIMVAGMLTVPRAMRAVTSLRRSETTLVAAVGVAFLFALLAHAAGYSVALGGFVAGALVRESGRAHTVAELLQPVRDIFAAIFFVAVGMLLDPAAALTAWPAIVVVVVVVLSGKMVGVTLGGFLAGFGIRTSVQAGMTLAQIGEFSFVIAGLGLAAGGTSALYPVAVTVSVLTALLTPLLMRLADPLSASIDRRLPRPVQTFVSLYEHWIELVRRGTGRAPVWHEIRRPLRWMVLDAVVIGGLIVGASVLRAPLTAWLQALGLGGRLLGGALVALTLALVAPFAIGLVTSARRMATGFAVAALPAVPGVDQAVAPRRALTTVLQIAAVLVIGVPLLALTQPFLSAWPGALLIGALLVLLAVSFWRSVRNLEGHAYAGAELIVDVLARQGGDKDEHDLEVMQEMLPGLGTIVPFKVPGDSPAVGYSLGELNVRGLTGVTIVALIRGMQRMIFPRATEVLEEGDTLAMTGSQEAIAAAHRLLTGIEHPVVGGRH
jgi:CPA2 family monovalent cation:H+ antiporter-2